MLPLRVLLLLQLLLLLPLAEPLVDEDRDDVVVALEELDEARRSVDLVLVVSGGGAAEFERDEVFDVEAV